MSPTELWAKQWKPQRIYRSRLEAWPTHYPEWWEAPQRQRQGARFLPVVLAFLIGLAIGLWLA